MSPVLGLFVIATYNSCIFFTIILNSSTIMLKGLSPLIVGVPLSIDLLAETDCVLIGVFLLSSDGLFVEKDSFFYIFIYHT